MDGEIQPTYPTNSLNFLRKIKNKQKIPNSIEDEILSQAKEPPVVPPPAPAQNVLSNGSLNEPISQPPLKLNILIVGAGLGGLATSIALSLHGHRVTILESAPVLGEVGAGIQIPPNSMRLLLRWGLGPFLEGKVVEPDGMTFRRWEDGRAIAFTRLIPDHRQRYGAPYFVVHRADFHGAMCDLALVKGVEIRTGCQVVSYDEEGPSVTLAGGKGSVSADLIVAADGIKSIARGCIPGLESIEPQMTEFAAYRATVDVEKMRKDPDTAWLVRDGDPKLNLWIGKDRHVMTYSIASGRSFNMVLSHKDSTDPSTWPTDPDERLAQMRSYYADWDPRLVKITHMIEKTMKWPLMTVPTSPRWLSKSHKLLILGDAAHGMLPYMSQGAAMAVEDGAALAEALSYATNPSQISGVLEVWQRLRVQRSSQMQQASAINGILWHFGDGDEQHARDESMRAEVDGEEIKESANQWSDPLTADWAYGYNAVEEVEKEMKRR